MKKLLCKLGLFQLLHCCFSQLPAEISSSIGLILTRNEYPSYNRHGILIEPDKVLAVRHTLTIGPISIFDFWYMSVGFNCHKFNSITFVTNCNSVKVKEILPYSDGNKTSSDLCVLILKHPVSDTIAKPIGRKKAEDKFRRNNCIFVSYGVIDLNADLKEFSTNVSVGELTLIGKQTSKIDNITDESLLENMAVEYTNNSMDLFIKNLGKNVMYTYLADEVHTTNETESAGEIGTNFFNKFFDQPIFCTTENNSNRYVLYGFISDYIWIKFKKIENVGSLYLYNVKVAENLETEMDIF